MCAYLCCCVCACIILCVHVCVCVCGWSTVNSILGNVAVAKPTVEMPPVVWGEITTHTLLEGVEIFSGRVTLCIRYLLCTANHICREKKNLAHSSLGPSHDFSSLFLLSSCCCFRVYRTFSSSEGHAGGTGGISTKETRSWEGEQPRTTGVFCKSRSFVNALVFI